jgi:hypothetical protein
MRKTLTFLALIGTAGALAACKMPWDSEPQPQAASPTTESSYAATQAPVETTATATPAATNAATDATAKPDTSKSAPATK